MAIDTKKLPNWLLAMTRWIDSWAGGNVAHVEEGEVNDKVDWVRAIPFIIMHGMCLGVIWVGVSWVAVAVCVFFYFLRVFFITGFYHRYFSHRTFKASRFVQFLLGAAAATAVQRGPLWWAAHHRRHHRLSDKEGDVHSPHQHSFMWSHIGWVTSKKNFPTELSLVPDLARCKELEYLDRFDILIPVLFATSVFFLGYGLNIAFPGLHTSGMQMLIWGFFVSTVFLFHATGSINSLAHEFGTQRFKTGDMSRNNFWLALLTMGEGWHNNHHHFCASARQGFYWYEVDMTYYILKGMEKLGIISELRPVPEQILQSGRIEAGNGRTKLKPSKKSRETSKDPDDKIERAA